MRLSKKDREELGKIKVQIEALGIFNEAKNTIVITNELLKILNSYNIKTVSL